MKSAGIIHIFSVFFLKYNRWKLSTFLIFIFKPKNNEKKKINWWWVWWVMIESIGKTHERTNDENDILIRFLLLLFWIHSFFVTWKISGQISMVSKGKKNIRKPDWLSLGFFSSQKYIFMIFFQTNEILFMFFYFKFFKQN